MRRVILESPYAGNVTENLSYLNECIRDSLLRGEAPFASHWMYTKAFDDNDTEQRKIGIQAGYAWWPGAERIIFYTDLGWSSGMEYAWDRCIHYGFSVEERQIR